MIEVVFKKEGKGLFKKFKRKKGYKKINLLNMRKKDRLILRKQKMAN